MESKRRVMFVMTTGEEVELVYPVCGELMGRGYEVDALETGSLCCGSNTKLPSVLLEELGLAYTSLGGYSTRNMAEVMRKRNPDVLVVGNDQEYVRRAFLYAAQGLGIPCMLVDVGIGSNVLKGHWVTVRRTLCRLAGNLLNLADRYIYMLRTVRGVGWGWRDIINTIVRDVYVAFVIEDARGMYGCQKIVVAGDWQRDVLVERGVDSRSVVITGNPHMVSLLRERDEGREDMLRKELGIGEGDKVILFHTVAQVEHGRWNRRMRREFVVGVLDALKPLIEEGVRVVLRIHPVENLQEYHEIVKRYAGEVRLCKGRSLVDFINISDMILFGGYSTIVLEAAVFGKCGVVLNMFNEVKNLPYEEWGLALCLYNYEDIAPVVSGLLYDGSIRNRLLDRAKVFLDRNKEFVDGKAVGRIADVICDLAGRSDGD